MPQPGPDTATARAIASSPPAKSIRKRVEPGGGDSRVGRAAGRVEAGLGVGFVSRWALRDQQAHALRTISVAGLTIKRSFQFVYPQGPDPDGTAAAFLVVARQFRGQFRTPDSR